LGFALVLAVFWGITWPVMKVALAELGPWTFRAVTLFLGALILLLVSALSRQPLSVPRGEIVPLLLVALFATTGWQLLSAYGVSLMRPGRAVIIGFTMPLWATLLSVFLLKERLTAMRGLGLGLGLAGMVALIGPDLLALRTAPLGAAIMVLAAMAWAVGIVLTKYFDWTIPTMSLAAWQLLAGSLPIVVGSLALEDGVADLATANASTWAATTFMVLIANSFCIYAYFKFIQFHPAHVAAIGILMVPVVGVVSSTVIVGDPIVARDVLALGLIVASLAIVMAGEPRHGELPGLGQPRRRHDAIADRPDDRPKAG
jgi:drug/metabolite transporter (DMT)-like permease